MVVLMSSGASDQAITKRDDHRQARTTVGGTRERRRRRLIADAREAEETQRKSADVTAGSQQDFRQWGGGRFPGAAEKLHARVEQEVDEVGDQSDGARRPPAPASRDDQVAGRAGPGCSPNAENQAGHTGCVRILSG